MFGCKFRFFIDQYAHIYGRWDFCRCLRSWSKPAPVNLAVPARQRVRLSARSGKPRNPMTKVAFLLASGRGGCGGTERLLVDDA